MDNGVPFSYLRCVICCEYVRVTVTFYKSDFINTTKMSSLISSSDIVVGYWGIRGLGAPLRMMVLFHGGYKLHCENYDLLDKPEGGYDASAWFDKKPALKEKQPLINLPYIIGCALYA